MLLGGLAFSRMVKVKWLYILPFYVDLINWGFRQETMSKLGTKKLVVVGGLLWVSAFTSLTSCSTLLSKVPVEKLPEPAKSMVIDARKDRAAMLKEYAIGSAMMLEAQSYIMDALGYEELALELKGAAKDLRQSSSDSLEASFERGKGLEKEVKKKLAKSDHKGRLGQAVYNKHFALTRSARDAQFKLLVTRAVPEIVALVKASKDASTLGKAAIIAESDRYLTVIGDFKKIDKLEETVDELAKSYNVAVKDRKAYDIDDVVKKNMPSGEGLFSAF